MITDWISSFSGGNIVKLKRADRNNRFARAFLESRRSEQLILRFCPPQTIKHSIASDLGDVFGIVGRHAVCFFLAYFGGLGTG